jgi:hypothetical protein
VHSFDLSREVVAVSLSLFDRYLATCGNQCNGNLALLTSLTTLAIAIKLYDPKRIKITTLANLSRGQFGPADIEGMEYKVLAALQWKLHPPTQYSFVSHLVLFLPHQVQASVRKEVFEVARYLTELAVCDSYFITVSNSTVAVASILYALEGFTYARVSKHERELFVHELRTRVGLDCRDCAVAAAKARLYTMFEASSDDHLQQVQGAPLRVTPSPTKMERPPPARQEPPQFLPHQQDYFETRSYSSVGSNRSSAHSRNSCFDSKGSCRYSPSPRRFLLTGSGAFAQTCAFHSSSPTSTGAM